MVVAALILYIETIASIWREKYVQIVVHEKLSIPRCEQ